MSLLKLSCLCCNKCFDTKGTFSLYAVANGNAFYIIKPFREPLLTIWGREVRVFRIQEKFTIHVDLTKLDQIMENSYVTKLFSYQMCFMSVCLVKKQNTYPNKDKKNLDLLFSFLSGTGHSNRGSGRDEINRKEKRGVVCLQCKLDGRHFVRNLCFRKCGERGRERGREKKREGDIPKCYTALQSAAVDRMGGGIQMGEGMRKGKDTGMGGVGKNFPSS